MQISSRALDADFLIDLPVLKGHCQTRMTCALKNLKGRLPDGGRFSEGGKAEDAADGADKVRHLNKVQALPRWQRLFASIMRF